MHVKTRKREDGGDEKKKKQKRKKSWVSAVVCVCEREREKSKRTKEQLTRHTLARRRKEGACEREMGGEKEERRRDEREAKLWCV